MKIIDVWFLKYKVWQTKMYHFGPFFALFIPLTNWKIKILIEKNTWRYYHFTHHMIYGSWDMECNRQNFSYSAPFFALLSPYRPKNKNSEKIKTTPEDMIILQICTINDSHMMHGSWDVECNRQNFLSFWIIFCPFTP